MKPGEYQQGGEGKLLRYVICECDLGRLLVAATEQGVCCVEMGDDPAELEKSLQKRFHGAKLTLAPEWFEPWLVEILESIREPRSLAHLEVDLQGTVFQRQVWQALREIPLGETRTYGEPRQPWESRAPNEQWPRLALVIPWRCSFPATVWWVKTVASRAIAGESGENEPS